MMNRKSQAALEFIMTYGWAILVVLVAIGALAYFGVLSPDRFLPRKCTFESGIACLDHKATQNSLTVSLRNSLGYDLTVDAIKADSCTAQVPPGVTSVPNSAKQSYTLVCNIAGNKYNGIFNLTFTNTETQVQHTNPAQITTRVE